MATDGFGSTAYLCIVCGKPVQGFTTRIENGKEVVDKRLPEGGKVHLNCLADLPPGWQVVTEKGDQR